MNIDLSKDFVCIIIDALCLLQKEKAKEYSKTLSMFKNPRDIAVCVSRDKLLDVSNLLGFFMEGVAE